MIDVPMLTEAVIGKGRFTADNLLDLPQSIRDRFAESTNNEVEIVDLGSFILLFPTPTETDDVLDEFAAKVAAAGLTGEELLARLRETRDAAT